MQEKWKIFRRRLNDNLQKFNGEFLKHSTAAIEKNLV